MILKVNFKKGSIGWLKDKDLNECFWVIFNSSYILLFNLYFYGIILKRKEIVIQWRKFEIKRSCIFKFMNLWSFSLFQIFNLNFYWIYALIKITKGVFFRGTRGWRGVQDQHAYATRHCGHVVGPHVAHARCKWRGHVAGGHTGPRGRPWGAPHGRVGAGIWRAHGLEVWGGDETNSYGSWMHMIECQNKVLNLPNYD